MQRARGEFKLPGEATIRVFAEGIEESVRNQHTHSKRYHCG
ncbi:MAG: hypothetical protein H6R26_1205 [Proteobacteria bacterium]|jgi:hypothetical protein|nr:hypothetical protein [Pseudomonadota bacterium]